MPIQGHFVVAFDIASRSLEQATRSPLVPNNAIQCPSKTQVAFSPKALSYSITYMVPRPLVSGLFLKPSEMYGGRIQAQHFFKSVEWERGKFFYLYEYFTGEHAASLLVVNRIRLPGRVGNACQVPYQPWTKPTPRKN